MNIYISKYSLNHGFTTKASILSSLRLFKNACFYSLVLYPILKLANNKAILYLGDYLLLNMLLNLGRIERLRRFVRLNILRRKPMFFLQPTISNFQRPEVLTSINSMRIYNRLDFGKIIFIWRLDNFQLIT